MKKCLALLFLFSLNSLISIALSQRLPTLYEKIEPLTKTYHGERIKFVMARFKNNEVMVATRKHAYTITKREAAMAGIIPPLPEVKDFLIEGETFAGVINIVRVQDFDRINETIVSDDGVLYFDENENQYRLESYIPDTCTFYKINSHTADTTGISKKKILPLPLNEKINIIISPGDIVNKLVTPELWKQQKEIILPEGYTLIKAAAYFAGTNFFNVHVQVLESKSLAPIANLMDSCTTGSAIVFDNIILKTPSGRLMRSQMSPVEVGKWYRTLDPDLPIFYFGSITLPRAEHSFFKRQKQIYIGGECEFVSASVYFSGAGFPEVVSTKLTGKSLLPLKAFLEKCQPGTAVTFDNIKVDHKNDGIRTIEERSFILY